MSKRHAFYFAGQIEAICLLLQQNKVQIDAKNVFGFTPLMKAAIQGHTRCAKALLLAGTLTTITSIYPPIQSNFNDIFDFM